MTNTTIKVLDHGFVTLRNLAGPTRRTGEYDPSKGGPVDFYRFDADDIDPAKDRKSVV